jgi:hypothetical protein
MFLNQILDEYKESDDKQKILNEFLDLLWNSKITYKKYKKYHTYKIYNNLLDNRIDLIDLFNEYKSIEYIVCKSKYDKNNMKPIDYIRLHINNMYGYLFDDRVYYNKQYYNLLLTPKREYFRIIKLCKENGSIQEIKYEDVKNNIENAFKQVETIKSESINKKYKMKWKNYQLIINSYIVKIFENYISVEDYENKNGWDNRVNIDGWSEDNYIIKYFCKSLTGYMRNYIKQSKRSKDKQCIKCGKKIPIGTRRKYCEKCAGEIQFEQKKVWDRTKRGRKSEK